MEMFAAAESEHRLLGHRAISAMTAECRQLTVGKSNRNRKKEVLCKMAGTK